LRRKREQICMSKQPQRGNGGIHVEPGSKTYRHQERKELIAWERHAVSICKTERTEADP
jgi:hypothetical protein